MIVDLSTYPDPVLTEISIMVVDNSDQAQSLVTGKVKKYTEGSPSLT